MSAADEVVKDIRAQILSRRLERGTRLPSEKELATHYDVSAPTIREAIRALSATSLVEARHGSGTYVTADGSALVSSALAAVVELEEIDLLSVLDVSEAFYVKAAATAVSEATTDELRTLRQAAEVFAEPMASTDFAAALRTFLTRLVELSHNKLLISISVFLIESQIALAQGAVERRPEAWEQIAGHLVDERLAIVDALEKRDADAAQTAVAIYMRRGSELVRAHASAP
ncbi:MAG: bacterial regulatory s, gntR family protein [Subtercola sp.]|nr:bacterial regulatory s, gntR family protein [Subtercola sp.]